MGGFLRFYSEKNNTSIEFGEVDNGLNIDVDSVDLAIGLSIQLDKKSTSELIEFLKKKLNEVE